MGAQQEDDLARNESFLTEARRLLNNGRPRTALSLIDRFSDDRYARKMDEYWQLRALALLMDGKFDQAFDVLFERGSLNRQFLDEVIVAIETTATRRPTRLWWNAEKRQQKLRLAGYDALEVANCLGLYDETRQRLGNTLPHFAV